MKSFRQIEFKHPLAIRWFHWINFPIIGLMVWSGFLIYWAHDIYRLGWGDYTLFKFFPPSWYEVLHLNRRLAEGMSYHFTLMWIFTINGILYCAFLLFSKQWKLLFPNKSSFKEALQVVLYDLHLSKVKPPQLKYNAAQRIAYTGVIVMGIGSLITGLAIYKPVQLSVLTWICGGYEWARAEHFILTILFCLFFLVHVIQVILAGWNNFLGMIRGFEIFRQAKIPAPLPIPEIEEIAIETPDDNPSE